MQTCPACTSDQIFDVSARAKFTLEPNEWLCRCEMCNALSIIGPNKITILCLWSGHDMYVYGEPGKAGIRRRTPLPTRGRCPSTYALRRGT